MSRPKTKLVLSKNDYPKLFIGDDVCIICTNYEITSTYDNPNLDYDSMLIKIQFPINNIEIVTEKE